MTGINNFLNYVLEVVAEAKKETVNERGLLNYCSERLPVTYPKIFLSTYYYLLEVKI